MRRWLSSRRIEAQRQILDACRGRWREGPDLIRETRLGLIRLHVALWRLRSLDLLDTRRFSRVGQRVYRTVQDGEDDGKVRPTETRAYAGEVEAW